MREHRGDEAVSYGSMTWRELARDGSVKYKLSNVNLTRKFPEMSLEWLPKLNKETRSPRNHELNTDRSQYHDLEPQT